MLVVAAVSLMLCFQLLLLFLIKHKTSLSKCVKSYLIFSDELKTPVRMWTRPVIEKRLFLFCVRKMKTLQFIPRRQQDSSIIFTYCLHLIDLLLLLLAVSEYEHT